MGVQFPARAQRIVSEECLLHLQALYTCIVCSRATESIESLRVELQYAGENDNLGSVVPNPAADSDCNRSSTARFHSA